MFNTGRSRQSSSNEANNCFDRPAQTGVIAIRNYRNTFELKTFNMADIRSTNHINLFIIVMLDKLLLI